MLVLLCAALAAVRSGGAAAHQGPASVTPVDKVLELLTSLKREVESEGSAEAATYDKFACFCKTETTAKMAAIADGDSTKSTLAGELQNLASEEAQLTAEIMALTSQEAHDEGALKKATEIRDFENSEYQIFHADLSLAVKSLTAAIASISGTKDSFLQTASAVQKSLVLADALGETVSSKALAGLMQGDFGGDVPANSYDFHSDDIISTLNGLLAKFTAQKNKVFAEEEADAAAFAASSSTMRQTIADTGASIGTKKGQLSTKQASTATKTGQLTEATATSSDDNTYLKDLSGQCEAKAREWDQRSQMRKDELEALSEALRTIGGRVSMAAALSNAGGRGGGIGDRNTALVQAGEEAPVEPAEDYSDVVFVQKTVAVHKSGAAALRNKAVALITQEATALKSVELSMLAMRMAADPFAKVKTLIQQLIERLLKESADEATQKGWCDTSLAKANTDASFRQADLDDLTASINQMNADKNTQQETVDTLTAEIHELNRSFMQASHLRNQEKRENKGVLMHARTGLDSLRYAIGVLQDFYKGAAKASVSLAQGSPVSADLAAAGAGHKGAYSGKQDQAGGILGMLATIESDFERTISTTEEDEKKQAAAFTVLDRQTQSSVAAKSSGIARNEADIKENTGDLKAALSSLVQNQDLLDLAYQSLETLRPACIDTKMSYSERVSRREAEVAALKKAVCVLDKEDDEVDSCDGNGSWSGSFLERK